MPVLLFVKLYQTLDQISLSLKRTTEGRRGTSKHRQQRAETPQASSEAAVSNVLPQELPPLAAPDVILLQNSPK